VDDASRARLSTSPLFGGMSEEELDVVCSMLEHRELPKGSVIVNEGDLGCELFYLADGDVVVTAHAHGSNGVQQSGEGMLARFGPGDCFGEMALIEIAPRSASVRALRDCRLYVLKPRDLRRLQQEKPHIFVLIIMNLARELSRRLRRAGDEITTLRSELAAPGREPGDVVRADAVGSGADDVRSRA